MNGRRRKCRPMSRYIDRIMKTTALNIHEIMNHDDAESHEEREE